MCCCHQSYINKDAHAQQAVWANCTCKPHERLRTIAAAAATLLLDCCNVKLPDPGLHNAVAAAQGTAGLGCAAAEHHMSCFYSIMGDLLSLAFSPALGLLSFLQCTTVPTAAHHFETACCPRQFLCTDAGACGKPGISLLQ